MKRTTHQHEQYDEPLFLSGTAARQLAVSQMTLSQWARQGKIRNIVASNGWRLFPQSEIERIKRDREGGQ